MKLHGYWILKECLLTFSDGRPSKQPFQKGMICYSQNGYMQATLSVHPREHSSHSGLERGHRLGTEEKAHAFDSYLSYGGRYTYDKQEVHHFVEFALNPSVIGATLKRKYRFDKDELVLSYTHYVRSTLSILYSLRWIRPT